MAAAVDGAPSLRWDLDVEVEGAEGASACHAVFAQLAASEEFARETWARRPLLLDAASAPADFAHSFTMDDVEVRVGVRVRVRVRFRFRVTVTVTVRVRARVRVRVTSVSSKQCTVSPMCRRSLVATPWRKSSLSCCVLAHDDAWYTWVGVG